VHVYDNSVANWVIDALFFQDFGMLIVEYSMRSKSIRKVLSGRIEDVNTSNHIICVYNSIRVVGGVHALAKLDVNFVRSQLEILLIRDIVHIYVSFESEVAVFVGVGAIGLAQVLVIAERQDVKVNRFCVELHGVICLIFCCVLERNDKAFPDVHIKLAWLA